MVHPILAAPFKKYLAAVAHALLACSLIAGAGPDSAGLPSAADTSATPGAEAAGAGMPEEAAPEEKRVVARFETLPPAGSRRPSAWSGTGRTWVWVGAAGLGVAGAVLGYHYLVDGEVPRDKVISLTD